MGDESQKRKKPERFYLNGRSAVAGGVFKSPMAENYFQLRQKWVQGRKKELLDLKEIDDTEFLCVVENRSDIFDIRSGDKEFKNVLIEGADLSGVDLTGLQLTNAIIRGVSFVGTKLDGSNLEGCIFIDCDWRGASLVGSNLGDCWFETSGGTLLLSEINFDQSTFEGTVFVAGIPECSFRHANLKGLWLRLCNLQNVDFTGAEIAGLTLDFCAMRNTTVMPDGEIYNQSSNQPGMYKHGKK